jgi:predicted Fe-Mo cluster-binding NifX family protein
MKIILTAISPSIDSAVDARFGRGANFLVVDSDTLEWQAHPNPGVSASGGAGTQAAQFVANQKAEAVISGDFGPHAFAALQAAGVSMYVYGDCRTAREAVECFKAGSLERVGVATRGECDGGHHDPA